MGHPEPDLKLLPPDFRPVAELAGICAAMKLVDWKAGVEIYIPQAIDSHHSIARCIGLASACKLVDVYPGDTIRIPFCAVALRAIRDAEIRARYETESAPKLCREYHIGERRLREIVKGVKCSNQGDLFES